MVKGSTVTSQQIPIAVSDIRTNKVAWGVPVIQHSALWGSDLEFAIVTVQVGTARTVFEQLAVTQPASANADKLRFSTQNRFEFQNTRIFDPHPTEVPLNSPQAAQTGISEPLVDYIKTHYPGGRSAFDHDSAFLDRPAASTSAGDLDALCHQLVANVFGDSGLPLIRADRLVTIWSLLSGTAAWQSTPTPLDITQDNQCFGTEDYRLLLDMGLTAPKAYRAPSTT
jgi:hypothetical protein